MDEATTNAIKVAVSEEVSEVADKDRAYFDRLFLRTISAIGVLLALATGLFTYLIGNTKRDLEQQLASGVTNAVIEYRLKTELKDQLRLLVQTTVSSDEVSSLIKAAIQMQASTAIQDAVKGAVEGKVQSAVDDLVHKGAVSEERIRTIVSSTVQNVGSLVPEHAVAAFSASDCPAGWQRFAKASGRYIVGVNEPKAVGNVIGQELGDNENRAAGRHSHPYSDNSVGGNVGIAIKGGGDYGRKAVPANTSPNDAPEGTNAPYVELLICEKTSATRE